jgi:phosphoenolpyruvate---glycerone phosphotransferase subunit DhaL
MREMDQTLQRELIEAVAIAIISHSEELTSLDQAIGDGDHGINMKRGFEAVLADIDGLATSALPDALHAIGMALLMKIGGASGPLYGTLFMTLGKELRAQPSAEEVARALAAAIAAIKARGKSDTGEKTMLDVLAPVQVELAGGGAELAARLRRRAFDAAAATTQMKALRGRASFLGERSIGHMDPGARSSCLMVAAICDVIGG